MQGFPSGASIARDAHQIEMEKQKPATVYSGDVIYLLAKWLDGAANASSVLCLPF